ncbi:MAG: hypothetical protein LBQ52_05645 [Helicobacteraceae bacterium]|jgi:hypothetical protein|nr:hypothetical protein [Helicobacteraceae bacterium]
MRQVLRTTFFLFFIVLFAYGEEFDRRRLGADGKSERVRISLDERIVINHTPDLIEITINEEKNYIDARALKKSGEGVAEIAPTNGGESRFIVFIVSDRPKADAFAWKIDALAKGAPPVLTEPPFGTLSVNGDTVFYSGETQGVFFAVYAAKDKTLAKKQIAVTDSGLIAIDAILEARAGEAARSPIEAAFKLNPAIVLDPEKGEATIDEKGIVFLANEGAEGVDRLAFIPYNGAKPITLPIRIINAETIGVKTPYSKVRDGVKQTIKTNENGGANIEFYDRQNRLLLSLVAPPRSRVVERDRGFIVDYGSVTLAIENNAEVKGNVSGSQISVAAPSNVVILSGGAIEAKIGRGSLYADRYGVRLASGDLAYPLLPSGSEAKLDAQGFFARAVLTSEDRFLPFGWIYGEDDEGELMRLNAIDESDVFLRAKWGEKTALEYDGESFEAKPIAPRKATIFLRSGWNPFVPSGDLALDLLSGVTKAIETAEENQNALWAQYDSRLPKSLNRLHRLHSGQMYQLLASQDTTIETFVTPQSPVWLKDARYVGVSEGEYAPLTLPNDCRLFDFDGLEANNYQAGEFYRLERLK